ncbi:GNAT family N-acetyltransferase [Alpinimonas psychrophila]|uniref:RimJ/RimL family protein N-acetyltransferase n=1 Tax=Alpinimonas psychrophila TaxID=748908 RepID=A0A7W3PMM1_9MICO|nr:GNAT family N-acetyltransferase [Alpinimonas psychrophila]MBA8828004.1 RimJ/RimL family protein N-acetyltransferase [Alpinimonas psychrophila]
MKDQVFLLPWTVDDLPVLQRSNTPEMTTFLGGPESPEQLVKRQANFLRRWEDDEARMFTIRTDSEGEPVGSVGYWKTKWANVGVYEAGWSIETRYQGRGLASRALRECLQHAAAFGDRQDVVAFPRVDNTASNSLCKSVGFAFRGEQDFEYPKGNPIRVNAWSFDLTALRQEHPL